MWDAFQYLKGCLVQFWFQVKHAATICDGCLGLAVLWEDGAPQISWWFCPWAKQQRNPSPIFPSLKHLLRSCFAQRNQNLKQSCAVFQSKVLCETQMFHSSKDLSGNKGSSPAQSPFLSPFIFRLFQWLHMSKRVSDCYTWERQPGWVKKYFCSAVSQLSLFIHCQFFFY